MNYKRRQPAPGVFRLVLPLPFPGLDEVNAYLLTDGDEATLVDCGLFLPHDEHDHGWDHITGQLGACGIEADQVTRLVLTHSHIDHYGMAGRVKAETGCAIWMQEEGDAELEILRDPAALREELRQTYTDHGVLEEQLDRLTAFEDWRGFVHSVVPADRWLAGDETFTVGQRRWKLIYTPGHARSHVCLWADEERLLISGDHLLPTITPHIDFRRGDGDPLGDFLDSLETVEKLDPAIVLPGHGRPFAEGAERARVTQRHHERRLGAIVQVVRSKACTANQITDEIFGTTLLNFQRRLALGEALAHIHYLRLRGEVERYTADDGTILYKKTRRTRPQVEVSE
jgi:glyoxylase-like metal-dependent hydrolase (beta-lactamase superfamily II)